MPTMPKVLTTEVEVSKDPFKRELEDIAKWAGLRLHDAHRAVLTFLGSTGGYLQRILAEDPVGALWVFILVGIGVVASLFAMATKSEFHIYTGWVLVAVGSLGAISAGFFKDFGVPNELAEGLLVLIVFGGGLPCCAACNEVSRGTASRTTHHCRDCDLDWSLRRREDLSFSSRPPRGAPNSSVANGD